MSGSLYYALVLCGVCLLVGLFLHAYISNLASIEEREKIIHDCNMRIQATNAFTAKCQACLYNSNNSNILGMINNGSKKEEENPSEGG